MRKRKKGSTFVIVIVVMAIIFTTGTAVLALTVNNYKVGINESKRLENLYKADSGLDTVENIIIKTSQEAIKYADNEVKNQLIKSKDYISKDEVNNIFKKEFYNFLTLKVKDINIKEATKTISAEEETILEYLILNKKLIETINKDSDDKFIFEIKDLNLQEENYKLEIVNESNNINKNIKEFENITIEINSTFESEEGEFKNERNVSKKYTIEAPEYSSDIKTINIYPVFDEKAITADGNMNIENNNLDITGNIWIKGGDETLDDNSSFVYDKYKNGIKVNNSMVNINGNIYSNNTLTLVNNNEVNINGNIYSRNIYIGKENYGELSLNNTLNLNKDVIVNNDLAINTESSTVSIKENFYGINDKTTDATTVEKALQSSSIIINEATDSNLNLNNAYILGVAYLNATDEDGKKYQTGESIAIKGNYLAYTDVNKDLVGNGITLKYYSPLQLLESVNGSDEVEEKVKYFTNYYNNTNDKNKYIFNYGGINISGDVHSVGASINKNGEIEKVNLTTEDNTVINNKKEQFAKNVFSMGDTTGLSNIASLYSNQKVEKTVLNQINFNNLKSNITKTTQNGTLIIKNNENLELINGQVDNEQIDKGLIIVNGNITIKGKFKFIGTIIATGDINFEDIRESEKKSIIYDGSVVRNVIADNYEVLKSIFNESSSKGKEVKISSSNEMYSPDNFLKSSLWKIER